MREPIAPEPSWPRYSPRQFPAYRFVPGLNPHPRRDRAGHSFGIEERQPAAWSAIEWLRLESWLYGVDLYNYSYWWECHEELEGLWIAAGRTSVQARFVQGVIQIAAASLNRHLGKTTVAREQAASALEHIERAAAREGDPYMGLRVAPFLTAAQAWFTDVSDKPPLIRLEQT